MLRQVLTGILFVSVYGASITARAVQAEVEAWLATRRALLVEPAAAAGTVCAARRTVGAAAGATIVRRACVPDLLWREDGGARWMSACAAGPPPPRDPRWAPSRWYRLTLACRLSGATFAGLPLRLLTTTIFR